MRNRKCQKILQPSLRRPRRLAPGDWVFRYIRLLFRVFLVRLQVLEKLGQILPLHPRQWLVAIDSAATQEIRCTGATVGPENVSASRG